MDTPRVLYKITASSPGSEAAADASAALASASIAFKSVNSSYSSKLLAASRSLFAFADKYRGSYQSSCPFYCSYSGYQDELLWAAAWLYKATGESQYFDYVTTNQGWSQQAPEFSWDNKFAGAQVLLAKEYLAGKKALARFKSDADAFMCSVIPGSGSTRVQTTAGGLLYTRDSANLQYASGAALLLLFYSRPVQCGSTNVPAANLTAFAKAQVDYVLGKNPRKFSYMAGFGSSYPRRIHHRGASIPSVAVHPAKIGCKDGFSSWYSTSNPNPNDHVGAVVGGPGQDDGFTDDRTNSARLEPATYMNAAFVGALAGVMAGVKEGVSCGFAILKSAGHQAAQRASQDALHRNLSYSKGTISLTGTEQPPKRIGAQILARLVAFFMTVFALLCSLAGHIMKKQPENIIAQDDQAPDFSFHTVPEEIRPPSPSPAFSEADLISSVLKRLGELEEKVDMLQSKPSEMPHEKEELLNAAVRRVDALEAELITTKKALHEALIRLEDLSAYVDYLEDAKYRKKKSCWY